MEASFWRRLWTCRQTEYWINESQTTIFFVVNVMKTSSLAYLLAYECNEIALYWRHGQSHLPQPSSTQSTSKICVFLHTGILYTAIAWDSNSCPGGHRILCSCGPNNKIHAELDDYILENLLFYYYRSTHVYIPQIISFHQRFPFKIVHAFLIYQLCYMPRPSRPISHHPTHTSLLSVVLYETQTLRVIPGNTFDQQPMSQHL